MEFGITYFDVILAEAIQIGLAREAQEEPPDNFYQLPKNVLVWKKIQATCKRQNMVVCLEITRERDFECLKIQKMFIDLARDFEDILFFRAIIEPFSTHEELREDVGGVNYTPTILVLFFDPNQTLCTKFERPETIVQSFLSGDIKATIIKYILCRASLKMIEDMLEPLSQEEQQLRVAYEKSFQSKKKECEQQLREEEDRKKNEEEQKKKKIEEIERKKFEEERKVREKLRQDRPKYVKELLAQDLEKMSSTELKNIMKKMEISSNGCIEKSDLTKRLTEKVPELRSKMNGINVSSCKSFKCLTVTVAVAMVTIAIIVGVRNDGPRKPYPSYKWSISPEHKTTLFNELQIIGNWYSLCTYLGVSEAAMEEYRYASIQDITKKERCLSDYINSGEARWDHVVRTVCNHPFKNVILGGKIAEKYGIPTDVCKS